MLAFPLSKSQDRLQSKCGYRPAKTPMGFDLWKPGKLVRLADIPENPPTEKFYLGDFGLVMKVGGSRGR